LISNFRFFLRWIFSTTTTTAMTHFGSPTEYYL
jgi:hypothetical protein